MRTPTTDVLTFRDYEERSAWERAYQRSYDLAARLLLNGEHFPGSVHSKAVEEADDYVCSRRERAGTL